MIVSALIAMAFSSQALGSAEGASAKKSRFTGTDAYCTPDTKSYSPKDVEDGITTDEVSITNVRLDVSLLKDIGFAFDYGNSVDQVNTFANFINDECGGIFGRNLVVNDILQPVPGLSGDPQLQAQESCTKIADDYHSIAAFSYTGIGNPLGQCLTQQNDVIFMAFSDFSDQDFKLSKGRLFSYSMAETTILTHAANLWAKQLKGKKIAVITDDVSPNPEVVQEGLMKPLKKIGAKATLDIITCGDDPSCAAGIIPGVQRLKENGAKIVFPLLSPLALPAFLNEMVTQGYEHGDVKFYNTSFQAQDSELVVSHIVDSGSEDAAALYDGANIVADALGGEWRLDGYTPDPFNQMCNDLYTANSKVITEPYDPLQDDDARIFSSVSAACGMVRLLAQALEAAGPNPTRAAVAKAIAKIGHIDTGSGNPASFTKGKSEAPDAIAEENFRYPCPFDTTNETGHCIVPKSDYIPVK